jgi:hypothetical protein
VSWEGNNFQGDSGIAMSQPSSLRWKVSEFGKALRRRVLGKSAPEYLSRLTGDNEYRDRAVAAQMGWPQGQPRDLGKKGLEPEYEPVFGLPKRRVQDWLAQNPGYRAVYEAELRKRRG